MDLPKTSEVFKTFDVFFVERQTRQNLIKSFGGFCSFA